LMDLLAKMGDSLIDLMLRGPKDEWGNLLAATIIHMGHVYLEKSGTTENDTAH
jgi:hypothetical protein